MHFIIIGISHKSAPIEIREQFFLRPIEKDLLISQFKLHPGVPEAFILSTCNRTEIYIHTLSQEEDIKQDILKRLFSVKEAPPEMEKHFYFYSQDRALKHLLHVASGVDSLVLGEGEILCQVKEAIAHAKNHGMLGRFFNILSNTAIRTGKKARSETEIGYGGSSVSWTAAAMVKQSFDDVSTKSALVIGAGQMGESMIFNLQNRGIKNISLINRTEDLARMMANKFRIKALPFSDIKEALTEVDFCISCAGAPLYLLETNTVKKVMQGRVDRPLLFLDISIPRNIDPAVGEIDGVTLKKLDDMKGVSEANTLKRQKAVPFVQEIIATKLGEFKQKLAKVRDLEDLYYQKQANV